MALWSSSGVVIVLFDRFTRGKPRQIKEIVFDPDLRNPRKSNMLMFNDHAEQVAAAGGFVPISLGPRPCRAAHDGTVTPTEKTELHWVACVTAIAKDGDKASFARLFPSLRAQGKGISDQVGCRRKPGGGMHAGRHGDDLAEGASLRRVARLGRDVDLHHRPEQEDRPPAPLRGVPNRKLFPGARRGSPTRPMSWHCSRI